MTAAARQIAMAAALAASAWAQAQIGLQQSLAPGFPLADFRLVDLTGDGARDLLIVGDNGQVRTFAARPGSRMLPDKATGALRIPAPRHTLLALAALRDAPHPPDLIAVSPDGIFAYRAGAGGAFAQSGTAIAPTTKLRRPRFRLRVGRPTFSRICRDMNGDGREDVLVPTGESIELWLNAGTTASTADTGGFPHLRRAARLPVKVRRWPSFEAGRLSDELESSFSVPQLKTADLNGDGRDDLIIEDGGRRAFHLQRGDGMIPVQPDVSVDLEIFRDTTPKANLRPGRTLAGGDRQSIQSRDLDGDHIPDYVVAHRRKVWVFHGRKVQGPQFTKPTQILRSADDVTALSLMDLQPDGHPDLVIVKVQVPSLGGLLASALGNLEVEVTAVGYASRSGHGFETTPGWRSDITVELPSVVSIMKNPYSVIRRFEEAGNAFESSLSADLDGDGKADVIVLDRAAGKLRIWHGAKNPALTPENDPDALMRHVLFEDKKRTWDLDRLVDLVGRVAQGDVGRRTGGRPADSEVTLRSADGLRFIGMRSGDVDGDDRDELVVAYRSASGATTLDVLGQ
jgi:hypothetical protein